ncbi:hypothetical protein [Sphingomonas sp. 3-13AW]|uniref:hypothetical protein n=1 Tax=Sphingomonas sp. 3-13AW TaxID=3050450 RepID=UPI003BB503A4
MATPRGPIEPAPKAGSSLRPALAACSLLLGAFAGSQAMAGDYATRDIGGWTVAASKDGKGCFVTREYDRTGQTTLLLGLETDGTNHLTVLNSNWSIKPKERLELTFRLSNASFPKHFAVGIASGGKQGFVTNFGSKFPANFAASTTLNIFRGDVPVERLSLAGSGNAVAELRRCVEAQRRKPAAAAPKEKRDGIPVDPFAGNSGRKSKR